MKQLKLILLALFNILAWGTAIGMFSTARTIKNQKPGRMFGR